MITWKEDELGKSAVVGGWLALAISRSKDGITASINGVVLPLGERKVEIFDTVELAEERLVKAAMVLTSCASATLKSYGQKIGFWPNEGDGR